MGAPRGLTPADLRALRSAAAELRERQGWTHTPERARALRLIGGWIDRETAAPLVFRMDRKGWRIGLGEGERVSPPSDAIGEAIYTLHAAVANPFEPQPIQLDPGVMYRNGTSAAKKRITLAKQFIGTRCPSLVELLKRVKFARDNEGNPVATYRPPANAPTICTQ